MTKVMILGLVVLLWVASCAASAAPLAETNPADTAVGDPASFEALVDQTVDQFSSSKDASLVLPLPKFGRVYVSEDGDDANSGTLTAPVRTIRKAMTLATESTFVVVRIKFVGVDYPILESDRVGQGHGLNVPKIIIWESAGTTQVRVHPDTIPDGPQESDLCLGASTGLLALHNIWFDEINLSLNGTGYGFGGRVILANSTIGAIGHEKWGSGYYSPGAVYVNAFEESRVYVRGNTFHVASGGAPTLSLFGVVSGQVAATSNQFLFPNTATAVNSIGEHSGDYNFPVLRGVVVQGLNIKITDNQFLSEGEGMMSFLVVGVQVEDSASGDGVMMQGNNYSDLDGSAVVIPFPMDVDTTVDFRGVE